MTEQTLAARLGAGETLFTSWSSLPDPLVAEALASFDFDAVTLDMQHGGHHEDSVLRGVGPIVAAGKGAIVRIPVGRFDFASRALDFGADAVIAPMINSVADARAFAASVKYPPVGQRSWGPAFAMPRRGDTSSSAWLAEANGKTLAFAMIETRAALDALDAILEVDGIDGVLVGPSDFSIAWTNGREMNPALDEMMEAIASIAGRVRAAGKHAAIYVVDPTLTGRYVEMGFRLFALGSDVKYLSLGAASQLGAARQSIIPR
ncbi:MAG: HpcH/HpaI aldolase family protein [Rhizobiaceae bacterium]